MAALDLGGRWRLDVKRAIERTPFLGHEVPGRDHPQPLKPPVSDVEAQAKPHGAEILYLGERGHVGDGACRGALEVHETRILRVGSPPAEIAVGRESVAAAVFAAPCAFRI